MQKSKPIIIVDKLYMRILLGYRKLRKTLQNTNKKVTIINKVFVGRKKEY
jgi:hypothetical protein